MPSLLKPCTTWDIKPNQKYGPGGNQVLDLYVPKNNGPGGANTYLTNPCVVVSKGGGWEGIDEDFNWVEASMLSGFVRKGFAIASVRYRTSGEKPHPAQIQDVIAAIRELRYRGTSWRIWPDKIGLWGFSAGGHLATLASLAHDDPAFEPNIRIGVSAQTHAVVADYPPTDFIQWVTTPGFESLQSSTSIVGRLFGRRPVLSIPDTANAASPAQRVTADAPPLWLRHGTADTTVPYAQSGLLEAAYDAAGIGDRCQLTPYPGKQHADLGIYGSGDLAAIQGFFDQHLQP